MLCLDSFTRINLKGVYNGPQLSDKIRKGIATFQSFYIPYRGQPYKLTHGDKLTLDIKEFTEVKFGPNILTQVLPHIERPDIVYCFDENNKSVTAELVDCFNERGHHSGKIFFKEDVLSQKFPDKIDTMKMVAIVIGNWNYFMRDTRKPTGLLRMKLDQLKLIGYIPVLIHWNDWTQNSMDVKEELLITKMNEALNLNK